MISKSDQIWICSHALTKRVGSPGDWKLKFMCLQGLVKGGKKVTSWFRNRQPILRFNFRQFVRRQCILSTMLSRWLYQSVFVSVSNHLKHSNVKIAIARGQPQDCPERSLCSISLLTVKITCLRTDFIYIKFTGLFAVRSMTPTAVLQSPLINDKQNL